MQIDQRIQEQKPNFSESLKAVMDCIGDSAVDFLNRQNTSHKIDKSKPDYGEEAYIELMNYFRKTVFTIPRKVVFSDELQHKMDNPAFAQADLVCKFADKFQNGEDVTGHLSRQVYDAGKWDFILNQWNIRHLHLSEIPAANSQEMKRNRSSYLLFFLLGKDSVFFLDVREHPKASGFTDRALLEIAERNGWIEYCGGRLMDEVLSLMEPQSNDEIYELFKNNINFALSVNGKYYHFGGVSASGNASFDSLALTFFKHATLDQLRKFHEGGFTFENANCDLPAGRVTLHFCRGAEKQDVFRYLA